MTGSIAALLTAILVAPTVGVGPAGAPATAAAAPGHAAGPETAAGREGVAPVGDTATRGTPAPIVESELATLVHRFTEDRSALARRYGAAWSPRRRARLRTFYRDWRDRLRDVAFEELGTEGRIDWLLLDGELEYGLHLLDQEAERFREMAPLLPFAEPLLGLHEARRDLEPVEPRATAGMLASLVEELTELRTRLTGDGAAETPSPIVGLRAADAVRSIRRTFDDWYGYFAGYDPVFTWWVEATYRELTAALESYEGFLRREVVGYAEGEAPPIVGDPIGADGLQADLRHEMIPYSPAELIEIAESEYAWCEARMIEASRELGFGDDWLRALEHVKTLHVPPGEQPAMVEDLYEQSVAFLKERELVTIPPLAEEVWRMEMMSPERQKVSPFFLGGEVIMVSYPTDGMAHDDKLMSMRGNNEHFSRATVHHELIPGHHLQGFMNDRYHPHRRIFRTPFWHEGNALYWEFRLWDLGFPRGPEDEVGMLFWRMHRAARIIFSLSFHLERMTPEEAIGFLVERVGHERANAEAEVRRSFNGSYPPLYQAAYMLGGLQFRALHEELVASGRMTERAFHDAILQGGPMPLEMVRARLLGLAPERDHEAAWRFYD